MDERRIRITAEARKVPDVGLYIRALIELARQELEAEAKSKASKGGRTTPPGDAA